MDLVQKMKWILQRLGSFGSAGFRYRTGDSPENVDYISAPFSKGLAGCYLWPRASPAAHRYVVNDPGSSEE